MALFFAFSIFILLVFVPYAYPTSFSFDFSDPNFDQFDNIKLEGDAVWNRTVISLTRDSILGSLMDSKGRASYKQPILLWNNKSSEIHNFTTSFTFFIKSMPNSTYPDAYGDGIAFFLSPYPSKMLIYARGGCLALIDLCDKFSTTQVVAVEFDTWQNSFDYSDNHVGINVYNIKSVRYQNITRSIRNGDKISATIHYNGATNILSVLVSFDDDQSHVANLSAYVDLKSVFNTPEIAIGFSAATGSDTELHHILRWSFNSTYLESTNGSRTNIRLLIGFLVGGFVTLVIITGIIYWCINWYRNKMKYNYTTLHTEVEVGPLAKLGRDKGDIQYRVNWRRARRFKFK